MRLSLLATVGLFVVMAGCGAQPDELAPKENTGDPEVLGTNDLLSTSQALASGSVVNAASYETPIAPGSLVAIYGVDLTSKGTPASTIPLPTNLGGVSVKLKGTAIPLLYAGPNQINAQIPYDTAPGAIELEVTKSSGAKETYTATVVPAGPGVFTADGSGHSNPIVTRLDYQRINRTSKPTGTDRAAPGEALVFLMNGLGNGTEPGATTGNPPSGLVHVATPNITIGGKPAEVLFAGMAPSLVAVNQVNLKVPMGVTGRVPMEVCSQGICTTVSIPIETNCNEPQLASPLGAPITVGAKPNAPVWLGDARPEIVKSPRYGIPIQTNGYHRADIHCQYRVRTEWIDKSWDFAVQTMKDATGKNAPALDQTVNKVVIMPSFGYAVNSVDQGSTYYRSALRTCAAGEKEAGRGGECIDDVGYYRDANAELHLCQNAIELEMVKALGKAIGLTQKVSIVQDSGQSAMVPCYAVLSDYVGWDCQPNAQSAKPVVLRNVCED